MSESKKTVSRSQVPLLHTKLMPPRLHATLLPRLDLLSRLDGGLDRKLTLITAPTGFGKTTLVRMWTESRDFAPAWVTLDENDNDPVRFWTYFITAIRTLDPELGKPALAMLMASGLMGTLSLTDNDGHPMLVKGRVVKVVDKTTHRDDHDPETLVERFRDRYVTTVVALPGYRSNGKKSRIMRWPSTNN